MDADGDEGRAETGLRCYVHRIAAGLGVGPESTYSELADRATAYVALEQRLSRFPARELALIWDEEHGWALAMETNSGEDVIVLAYYGRDLLPEPEKVIAFTKKVLAGRGIGQRVRPSGNQRDVRTRLADYLAMG